MAPTLYLFPNLLGDLPTHEQYLPATVDRAVENLDGLIAESEKGGRRFLSRFNTKKPKHHMPIALFNEHTEKKDLDFLLEPVVKGESWGFVSDAGLPCLADPGSTLVERARQLGIVIKTFVGPSSILLALVLSGLPAQRFSFHGYIDRNAEGRKKQLHLWENRSLKEQATQIFMETPYRNEFVLKDAVETLQPETHLCVAWNLTMEGEGLLSQPIKYWKKSPLPNLDKKPAIFLINKKE